MLKGISLKMVHFNRKPFEKCMIKHYVSTLIAKCILLVLYKHSGSNLFARYPILTQTEVPVWQGVILGDCVSFVEAA
jgi:hypothetical protein